MLTLKENEDMVIDDLAIAMKFKFSVHRNEGGWTHKSKDVLYTEMLRECEELKGAKTKEQIISECADIANYAAMIADLAKRTM